MIQLNNHQSFADNQFQSLNQTFDQVFPNQQTLNQPTDFNQNQQDLNQNNNQLTPKGFFQIPEQYLRLISLAPFALEMLTGQKLPPTGAMADILNGVQTLHFNLNQVLANQNKLITGQQQLWNKLNSLEKTASSQLTNLKEQVINTSNSFKMLATETKRSLEIERKPPISEPEQELESNEYN